MFVSHYNVRAVENMWWREREREKERVCERGRRRGRRGIHICKSKSEQLEMKRSRMGYE